MIGVFFTGGRVLFVLVDKKGNVDVNWKSQKMFKLNKGDTLMATSEKGKFQQKGMITLETKQLVEINASLFSKM